MQTSNRPISIFISYRHDDEPDFSMRIRDNLINEFGRANVFVDRDSIKPGDDWEYIIRREIEKSNTFLLIIGSKWLNILEEKSNLQERDIVLIEIKLALKYNKKIIPICVKGNFVPKIERLPISIRPILKYHFSELYDNSSFYDEMKRIILVIKRDYVGKIASDIIDNSEQSATQFTFQFPQITNQNHDEAKIYYEQAREKYFKNLFTDAISLYNQVLELVPRNPHALNERGICKKNIGDIEGAIEDYTASIDLLNLNPFISYTEYVYLNRGISKYLIGDAEEAIHDFTSALKINPEFAQAYRQRAISYHRKGDHNQAIADYTTAIQVDNFDWRAYANRGNVNFTLNKLDSALEDVEKSITLAKFVYPIADEIDKIYFNQAQIYKNLDNIHLAIKSCSTAIEYNSHESNYFASRGWWHYENGDFDNAIQDYEKAISLNEKVAHVYHDLAMALAEKGLVDLAISNYYKAIMYNHPKPEWTYTNLSGLYLQKNQPLTAIDKSNTAIKFNPNYPNSYIARGLAYAAIGKEEKGYADFEKFLQLNGSDKSVDQLISEIYTDLHIKNLL